MEPPTKEPGRPGTWWIAGGLVIALLGTGGSLFLSLGMELKACPLCFYQRSFMMGVMAVLAVGLATDRAASMRYGLVSIPMAAAGLGVAAFHEYLVVSGVLECPPGVFGIGTAPFQSLALFVVLTVFLILGTRTGSGRLGAIAASVVLGLLLAWGSVASSPPLPPAPSKPYDPETQPLEMCRPKYHAEAEDADSES